MMKQTTNGEKEPTLVGLVPQNKEALTKGSPFTFVLYSTGVDSSGSFVFILLQTFISCREIIMLYSN